MKNNRRRLIKKNLEYKTYFKVKEIFKWNDYDNYFNSWIDKEGIL